MLKLYVLIRDDITEAQQAVQAGHAVAQFGYDHPLEFRRWQENGNTLVYLSVERLSFWKTLLEDGNIKHSRFHDPDIYTINNRSFYPAGIDTAIAVAPNWTCQYLLFKNLPLALQPKPRAKAPEPEKKRSWWRR